MNLKTHKIIVSIALTLVLCTGAALLAQAFFQAFTDKVEGNVTIVPPSKQEATLSEYYVKVSTEAELIAATKDDVYNANDTVSETAAPAASDVTSGARCIILLTNDIKLSENLLVTRDCHIDLGGFMLDTNGFDMTVYHTYKGTFIIANGTLKGKLITNTPNAVVLPDTEGADDSTVLEHEHIAYDPEAVCRGVLSMVAASITNHLPKEHGIYGLLDDSCSLPNYTKCPQNHPGCCFATGDLDLPHWFFGYEDVQVVYSSANNKIDAAGHVTLPSDTEESAIETLTVTVKCGDIEIDPVDFTVHLLSEKDYSLAAAIILTKQLEDFWDSENQLYQINTQVLLPPTVAIGNEQIEMTYSSGNNNVTKTETDGVVKWVFSPADNTEDSLIINDGAVSVTVKGDAVEVKETAHTIANKIMNDILQGGTITINKLSENNYSTFPLKYDQSNYVYSNFKLAAPITFTLSNDLYQAYEIKAVEGVETIGVQNGKTPEEYGDVQQVYLKSELQIQDLITAGTPITTVTIYTPIQCTVDSSGGSTNVSEFSQYYHYFNKEFATKTGGYYTYSDFEFPVAYNNDSPEIKFYALAARRDADGNLLGYTFEGATELTEANTDQEFPYLKVYKDAVKNVWVFDFDQEQIGLEDIDLAIGYSYRFKGSNGNFPDEWQNFAIQEPDNLVNQYTLITVAGVINRTEDCTNPALYKYLYSIYHPEDTSYVPPTADKSYDPDVDYILSNRRGLTKELDLDKVELPENEVKTYLTTAEGGLKGLELLTGVIKLKADGVFTSYKIHLPTLGANDGLWGPEMDWDTYLAYIQPQLDYVTGMTSLEELDLSNNGIADAYGFDTAWDPIGELAALTNLRILHIENNSLYNFDSLTNFQSLTKVHVHGNTPEFDMLNSQAYGGILAGVNALISGAVERIYGSEGAVSTATFSSIYPDVSVYNDAENPTTPFAPSGKDASGIAALKSIEYQNKVPAGMDITPILNQMPTDLEAYGIAPNEKNGSYSVFNGQINGADDQYFTNKIEFVLPTDEDGNTIDGEDAEYFILRYTDFVVVDIDWYGDECGFEYTIEIEFPIERTN